jgi:hypothetical protein
LKPSRLNNGGRGGRREGAGRKKGTPNRISGELREAVVKAFKKVGGVRYLEDLARTQPKSFCLLLHKLLPTELATSAGPLNHEIVLKWVTPEMIRNRGLAPETITPPTGQD